MKTKSIIVLALALALAAGCYREVLVARYFLLEYQPAAVNPEMHLAQPLPYRVLVSNFKIPRSYDSVRIIGRYSAHEISYYRYSLWAVRPQVAIADMLVQHVNVYHLFRECQREFLEERPDYEISGTIDQIECFESSKYSAAHVKMTFTLSDYSNNEEVVVHDCDREVPIPPEQMTIFAKAVSDLVQEETEKFLVDVVTHFQSDTSATGTVK